MIKLAFPNSSGKRTNITRKHRRPHFSKEVQEAKRRFKNSQKAFKNKEHDITRRQQFIRDRREYKRAIYLDKKIQKTVKINRIANLESSDPKVFWKELKSILSPKNDSTELIGDSEWFDHFNKLLNAKSATNQDKGFLDYVKSSLPYLEHFSDDVECLNGQITEDEINTSVKDLKMKKATHFDNIGNECIKYGLESLKGPLIHLYNTVIDNGTFPEIWSDGLIVPMHKKEDRLDTNNYRGIIISSCLGKLFLRILTKRINDFMDREGKWSNKQCGFKKDHRTEDNLFILNNLVEKYVKSQKKKVYVAFVDFSKFFDKINRHIMLYKLLKYGISGKIYQIIKSVYNDTSFAIKIGGRVSPKFTAINGLKQGCCLSPTLSNIFQNDLHEIFDNNCDPVTIGTIVLNSISWADDLILMSLSKNGLQECLNRLSLYCRKWGLEVNIDKTKTMVFGNKFVPETFYYDGMPLTQEKEFLYLGFLLSYNGNISSVMNDRIKKATKVSNMVMRAIRTNKNISTKLAMSIYDKQISPIMLYGCAIWSIPKHGNLLYLDNQPELINTRKHMNEVFMNILGTKLPFEYARRVGKYVPGQNRRFIIKMKNYTDKTTLLSTNNSNYIFNNFTPPNYSDISKNNLDFCKKSLNISKFSSNTAVQYELGRGLIEHKAFALAIKYWLRLTQETKNVLLNESFKEAKRANIEWIQGIQSLLHNNGFGYVFSNPETVNPKIFHTQFRQRLNDQNIQKIQSKIENDDKFNLLSTTIKNDQPFECQKYINIIRNPEIREIFTKLRINTNKLQTSKMLINKSDTNGVCTNCDKKELESPHHMLFRCEKFSSIRTGIFDVLSAQDSNFQSATSSDKDILLYVLDLRCPPINTSACCKLVSSIYKERLRAESE